jgi:ABC-type nitrate/sulfonate/bicarbonate transport system substrate-binding protein
MRKQTAFSIVFAFVFGAFELLSPAHAADTVRILTARPGWQAISVWYAKDLGLFAKHSVDVKHTALDSSPAVMEAFVSGQADIAIANVGTAVNAYFRGVPLRIVDGTPASDYPIMAVSPAIKSLADLKGKKIAIWSVPSDATLALDVVAKKQGINAANDFTYVRVPAQNVCDTVKRNQADAGIVFEPYASACLLDGAHRVAPAGTVSFDPPKLVSSSVIIVNADFLAKHTQDVKDAVQALDEAVSWAAKHKGEAVASLAKYSGQPEKAIALSYDSANFDITIDRGYHDILLQRYEQAKLIKRVPSADELKTLYQTDLVKK